MKRFIIRISPNYKETLKEYGTIIFDSQLINGLLGIETDLSEDELWNIPHVFKVEADREGSFN